ncbi:hypothetical protein E2C01_073719 [Portunus trituberculatus]|uniref:Uncharacterized protein n=1 Tax=Portunus trituberculatus TaxID=210409 RepID=A0A5B7IEM0_PORTR|nr:hypothetical protein [Portunus trituberculatus]
MTPSPPRHAPPPSTSSMSRPRPALPRLSPPPFPGVHYRSFLYVSLFEVPESSSDRGIRALAGVRGGGAGWQEVQRREGIASGSESGETVKEFWKMRTARRRIERTWHGRRWGDREQGRN